MVSPLCYLIANLLGGYTLHTYVRGAGSVIWCAYLKGKQLLRLGRSIFQNKKVFRSAIKNLAATIHTPLRWETCAGWTGLMIAPAPSASLHRKDSSRTDVKKRQRGPPTLSPHNPNCFGNGGAKQQPRFARASSSPPPRIAGRWRPKVHVCAESIVGAAGLDRVYSRGHGSSRGYAKSPFCSYPPKSPWRCQVLLTLLSSQYPSRLHADTRGV